MPRALFVLALLSGAATLWSACSEPTPPAPVALPQKAEFVGSERCKQCHEERHETWLKTAHAYALRDPTPAVIEGAFDGKTLDSEYFRATPYRKDGRYFVRIKGKDGRPDGDHEITRVIGRSFEQAYLTTDETGRWLVMPICWSRERREWDLTHKVLQDIAGHVDLIPPDYDTRQHVFNHGCGQCHATDYDVGHDPETDTLHSTFLEGAVACESCHGPGSVHESWHEEEKGDDDEHQEYAWPARLVHPKKDLNAREVLDSCGRCHYTHEWYYAIDADPRVGYEQIAVSLNRDSKGFFLDGRVGGLLYHGTTQSQSPCFLKGDMSCLSCHRMHGGKKWAMKWDGRSNKQCTQCHDADQHGEEHTHHPETIACVDCHMPRFLKGALHFLRDHSIRAPDPSLTAKYGQKHAPNACNQCHIDKDVAWAGDWRLKWWGEGDPVRHKDTDLVARLRQGAAEVPTAELIATVDDAERRTFVRLTALAELIASRLREPAARTSVRGLLEQDDVELLQHASLAQTVVFDPAAAPALMRLLEHPVRTVRVISGAALLKAGWRGGHGIDDAMKRVYKDARDRLVRQRQVVTALEQIALFADAVGSGEEADEYYRRVIRLFRGAPGQWRPQTIGLTHRMGRRATDAGRHADALKLYALVSDARRGRASNLLRLDRADSLAEVGRIEKAVHEWRAVLARADARGAHYAIARARLDLFAGGKARAATRLKRWAEMLERNPVGGDLLRRVRWAQGLIAPSR